VNSRATFQLSRSHTACCYPERREACTERAAESNVDLSQRQLITRFTLRKLRFDCEVSAPPGRDPDARDDMLGELARPVSGKRL
jgi:hypothetical protein